MKSIIYLILFFPISSVFAQENPNFKALDSLYREDQFYVGITYNTLQNKPSGISQNKFTPSFSIGFLRDMPLNKSRTVAIALGLGYAINSYNQNLQVNDNVGELSYSIINTAYEKNKLSLHYLEIPLEVRWRNSTPESHKFMRIYTGFKLGYLVYDRLKYVDGVTTNKIIGNSDLNKIQFGTYLSFGYNTWNFNIYYGLNPIFKTGTINSKPLEMKNLNFGLMFYIL